VKGRKEREGRGKGREKVDFQVHAGGSAREGSVVWWWVGEAEWSWRRRHNFESRQREERKVEKRSQPSRANAGAEESLGDDTDILCYEATGVKRPALLVVLVYVEEVEGVLEEFRWEIVELWEVEEVEWSGHNRVSVLSVVSARERAHLKMGQRGGEGKTERERDAL
jgi:hypothetical protein